MAIYEFLCQECGYRVDLIRKMSDASVEVCPECKNKSFYKQVSAPSFKLSGSGWYESDFKNNSKNKSVTKPKKEKQND